MLSGLSPDTVSSRDLLYFQLLNEDVLSTFSFEHYRRVGRGAVSLCLSAVMDCAGGGGLSPSSLEYTRSPTEDTVHRYLRRYNPKTQMVLLYRDAACVTERASPSTYKTHLSARSGSVFATLARLSNVEPEPGDWDLAWRV